MQRLHHLILATVLFFPSSTLAEKYEITVLATNIANFGGFGEWSFSALYEGEEESILFDTGWDDNTVLHNAKILNKDLSKVEKVVLSHWHFDHTGGLLALRDRYRTGSGPGRPEVPKIPAPASPPDQTARSRMPCPYRSGVP
mgnify:CR=1 FL=1